MRSVFHLAYNVRDLSVTREFYGEKLGCKEGRSTATWVDFCFFGHQISLHLGEPFSAKATGKVDGHNVPMPHLGVILPMSEWRNLVERLEQHQIDFVLPPNLRFEGETGEQATMFFLDPSGNPIEIKGFKNMQAIFDL